jgi:flagellar motor switch/type III secretory pathway protein FliN
MNAAVQQAVQPDQAEPKPEQKDPAELFGWLQCQLLLELPVARFTGADLLRLSKGSIIATEHHHTSDIPLYANGTLIGWTEFEVIGDRLAVRVTELA